MTLLELTAAYAALANPGARMEPIPIRYITDPQGRLIDENIPQGRADLAALAKQLAQPLEVRYGSPSCLAHLLARRAAGECRSPMGGAGSC